MFVLQLSYIRILLCFCFVENPTLIRDMTKAVYISGAILILKPDLYN